MRVFIAGGTGLIGSRLIARLKQRQDTVVLLTRRAAAAREKFGPDCTIVEGDPMQSGPWMDAVADCDGVINLVGEPIFARRWNMEFKALLRDSRVRSTQHVVQALEKNPHTAAGKPRVLVNASAIGYYGPHGDEELAEDSPPGNDFLAGLTVEWEAAARKVESSGVRLALVRVGVVLDKEGGALRQMLTPFKLGVGGKVGSGTQWMSWIHHADMAGIFLLALDHPEAKGPINGTAPEPVTNKSFSKALGRALHRPSFLPTPALGLRVMMGEVAEVVTAGQRVLPRKALALGYSFQYGNIDAALADVVG
jgi:uncharacterized protein (TIGR01777 family)